jgi:hypothetical protein
MAAEPAVETIETKALKRDLTRMVLEQLDSQAPPPKRSTGPAVSADGPRRVGRTDPAQIVAAVSAAVDHYLHDTKHIFLIQYDDRDAAIISKVMAQVPRAVRTRQDVLTEAHLDALVDLYLAEDPLAGPMAEIERDNAEAQARFIETVKCYSAEELAGLAGHSASNRSATATRWKTQQTIFGLRRLGRDRYPAFQFQEGRPRPIIGKVLKTLPADMSAWQTALWFASPNGWLEGRKPVDCLRDEAALLTAAKHEGDDWVG